jgi:phospholipid-translocating ATPase
VFRRGELVKVQVNKLILSISRSDALNRCFHFQIACEDIHVGDIVCVHENEEVPADLVLLKTSHHEPSTSTTSPPSDELVDERNDTAGLGANQLCYIETANIDGETHLKERLALPQTAALSLDQIATFDGLCTPFH